MTKQEIDAIRARCAMATPGRWQLYDGGNGSITIEFPNRNQNANADFIRNAREDILRLLDALEDSEGCEGCNAQNARWKLAVRNATERRKQAEAERDVLAERLARVDWPRQNDGLPYVIEVNSASAWLAWAREQTKGGIK